MEPVRGRTGRLGAKPPSYVPGSVGAGAGFAAGRFHHGFHRRAFFVGAGPYAYYDDYPYYYDDGYYGAGGCYIVRQRVHTRHGWRLRAVQVCE